MKRIILFFFIGIFFFILSKYILDNLSPFNLNSLNNLIVEKKIKPGDFDELNKQLLIVIHKGDVFKYLSSNAYLGIFTILNAFLSFFIVIHLLIDKVFFKNYFEKASFFNAFRRGLIIVLTVFFAIYFKLYGLDNYIVALPVFSIIIELLFSLHINDFINNEINKIKITIDRLQQRTSTRNKRQ